MNKTIWEALSEKYNKIDKRYRVCFYMAIICALMAHIYALTNHLYNYDELWHTPTGFGTGTEVGRWALSITVWIQKRLFYDVFTIPAINGMVTIILYALSACFVVSVLDIQDEFYAGLTGALMLTFPALVSRMFFMFTTHYYAIGIFMASVGVWMFTKCKRTIWTVAAGLVFVIYGMAIYQANFVTAVCMMIGYLMIRCIREDDELKALILKCISSVAFLGGCMAIYLVGSKVALAVTGKQMQTYENLDTMGQLSVNQLIGGIIKCYKTFLKIPVKDVYAMNPNGIVKVTFLLGLVVLVYSVLRIWMSKKQMHIKVLFSLMMAVLPVAVNLIAIMAFASGTMYSIMVYEIVYMFIIPIGLLEAYRETCENDILGDECKADTILAGSSKTKKIRSVLNGIFALALTATVATYIWFANGNYLAMEYTNNHDVAYYTVLMTQIKSIEGYSDEMSVALIGKPGSDKTNNRQSMIGDIFRIGGKASSNIGAYSSWNIMTRVVGFDPVVRDSDEDEEYFYNLDEVKSMPIYPDTGSIKIIDDTIVIKFQDVEEIKYDWMTKADNN